ncbi:MAG: hypothetical protein HYW78_00645 [Parcubacteria group bacterium]|nr:hypothetical protein [Parcubacteria group bacterium]
MSKVYAHLKPFSRLVVFTETKIRELEEEIGQMEKLNEDTFFGIHQAFGNSRVQQLDLLLEIKARELGKWRELLASLNVCARCNGEGSYRSLKGYFNCEQCNGTGRNN